MADDSIRYEDLVKPDDSIKNATAQLEGLIATYQKLQNETKQAAVKAAEAMKAANTATDAGKVSAQAAAQEAAQLNEAYKALQKQLTKAQAENKKLKEQEVKDRNAASEARKKENAERKKQIELDRASIALDKQRSAATLKLANEKEKQATAEAKAAAATKRENELLSRQANTIEELQKQTSLLTKQRKQLDVSKDAKEFNKLTDAIKKNNDKLKSFDADVGNYQRNVGNYASAFKGAFMNLAGAFGLAGGIDILASGLQDAFVITKEYEKENAVLASVLGKTLESTTELQAQSKELGATTAFSSTQVAELQTALARLGKTEAEILDSSEGIINATLALGSETGETATLVGATLNAFNLSASKSGKVADILTLATQRSALSFESLNTSLPIASGAAAAAGVSLEDLTAQLGQAADRGIDASSAATSLRNIYIELSANGLTYEQAMQKINASQDKLSTASALFGKRAATTALALAENADKAKSLSTALSNAGGTAKFVAETQLNTLDGRLKLLNSAWEGFILSMNNGNNMLSRVVNGVVSFATSMLGAATDTEKLSAKLSMQKTEFNGLIGALQESNVTNEERSKLITEINSKYGEYLPNLLTEKSSLEDIEKAQKAANAAFVESIETKLKEEKISDILREKVDLEAEAYEKLKQIKAAEARSSTIQATGNQLAISSANKTIEVLKEQREELLKNAKAVALEAEEFIKSANIKTGAEGSGTGLGADEQAKALALANAKAKAQREKAAEESRKQREEAMQARQLEIDAMQDEEAQALAQLELNHEKRLIQYEKYDVDITNITDQYLRQRAAIRQEYDEKEKSEVEAKNKALYDAKASGIQEKKDLDLSEIETLKTTEQEKTRLTLEAERDRIKSLLAISKMAGSEMSETQIKILENQLKAVNGELEEQEGEEGEGKDIYEILGINLGEDEKAAIAASTKFAMDTLNYVSEQKSEAAAEAVADAEDEVSAAETALAAQQQAQANGYASNVATAQKELTLAQATEAKALKEQEKAQKAQAAIQSIQQVGNLVTGATKIWGQLGFPFAIPAIAGMFGSFALAKIKAGQATKQQFGDGDYSVLKGGSHASGKDIYLGTTSEGVDNYAEGGEGRAIFTRRSTQKYGSVLPDIVNSINRGIFEKKFVAAKSLKEKTGRRYERTNKGANLSTLERGVATIAGQSKKQTYIDEKGRRVVQRGSKKRIYKNGN